MDDRHNLAVSAFEDGEAHNTFEHVPENPYSLVPPAPGDLRPSSPRDSYDGRSAAVPRNSQVRSIERTAYYQRPSDEEAGAPKAHHPMRAWLIVGTAATVTAATVIAAVLLPKRGGGPQLEPSLNPFEGGGSTPAPTRRPASTSRSTTWANADAVGCTLPLRARSRFFASREAETPTRYLDTGTRVTIEEVSSTTSNGIDHKCRVRLDDGTTGWVFIGGNEVSVCPARPAGRIDAGFSEPTDDDGPLLGAEHFGYEEAGGSAYLTAFASDCAAAYLALRGEDRAAIWREMGVRPSLPEDRDALALIVRGWIDEATRLTTPTVDGFRFCRLVSGVTLRPAGAVSEPEVAPDDALLPEGPAPAGCAVCHGGEEEEEDTREVDPAELPQGYTQLHGVTPMSPPAAPPSLPPSDAHAWFVRSPTDPFAMGHPPASPQDDAARDLYGE